MSASRPAITVSGAARQPIVVEDDEVVVAVTGGIGPPGPAGAGGVVSLQGLTGALTLAVVGGTVSVAGSTITLAVTAAAVDWSSVTGKPATFTPSAHAGSHATGGSDPLALAIGQITGLQTALDGKQAAGSYAAANHGHAATAITYAGGPVGNVTGATVDAALNSIDADLENRISTTQFAASFSTGLSVADGVVSVAFGATSTTVCIGNDARLSDAREWSASTISQAEAEAGTATTRRAFTAQRIFQAIAAWWNASTAKTKLDGIAVGATANQTDAYLLSRANHTGTQSYTTIAGLGTLATQSGTFSGASSGTNTGDQTITLTGDVTGSGTGTFAATVANSAITYAKIQNVSATDRLLGRSTSGSGVVEEIVCTSAGRALIDDADAAAQRATLGAQKSITSGTAAPTGGSDGDIYLQYS